MLHAAALRMPVLPPFFSCAVTTSVAAQCVSLPSLRCDCAVLRVVCLLAALVQCSGLCAFWMGVAFWIWAGIVPLAAAGSSLSHSEGYTLVTDPSMNAVKQQLSPCMHMGCWREAQSCCLHKTPPCSQCISVTARNGPDLFLQQAYLKAVHSVTMTLV